MTRVLVVGASTRAAAESAARAGFDVTAVDGYADRDQHPSVRALRIAHDSSSRLTAASLARAARSVRCDAVVYLSPFENHPHAVATLAARRTLWGNSPETLRRVRDPFRLRDVLRRNGFPVPRLYPNDPNGSNGSNGSIVWLIKPLRSGGGRLVRGWDGGAIARSCYVQERIDGQSGSLVFAAAGGSSVTLGFSRQLVGDPFFGAESHSHRYCGSIAASIDDEQFVHGDKLLQAAVMAAQCVTREFGLVGLNGIDFVARDGVLYPVEVNPRWSSSMEIAEQASGVSFMSVHADACARGTLPPFDGPAFLLRNRGASGKAIVYARVTCSVGDTAAWLEDPAVRDVPRSGERFRAGQPVCTVLASARTSAGCYRALTAHAERVYAELTPDPARRAG